MPSHAQICLDGKAQLELKQGSVPVSKDHCMLGAPHHVKQRSLGKLEHVNVTSDLRHELPGHRMRTALPVLRSMMLRWARMLG